MALPTSNNTLITHDIIAKDAAVMFLEESTFVKSINRDREQEFGKDRGGYTAGESVRIKIPPTPVVTDGDVWSPTDAAKNAVEETILLKVDTPKHVGLKFGSVEQALKFGQYNAKGGYKERILKPAVKALVSVVEADMLQRAITLTNNFVANTGPLTTLSPYDYARAALQRNLCPDDNRKALITSNMNVGLVSASRQLFNSQKDLSKQYTEGWIGRYAGFDFHEHQSLYRSTNGTQVAGVTVSGASQTGGTLAIGGVTNGTIFKAGMIFTLTGVNMLHPLTKQDTGVQMQFVVLADATMGGTTGALSIYPKITPQGQANANVTASPASGTGLTFVGAANQTIEQGLAYQGDAYAAAFVPQKLLAGCVGSTFDAGTFAIRCMTFGDGVNNFEGTRLDVLYGFTGVRNNWGVRTGVGL
ncbi:P22 phage major capsid protein family protein [Aquirhabdus parva]|uniref:P22 coat-protein 5 family protein n=1 Tax=Aquirhabdus parva TaxID=2283318 RepID=A0A345P9A3_9GAMM|nr:P22 phage major capsid protein family protein [Aquirhabdus parva]AXI03862.1 hypothetical protein HYN46_14060 [Aquirhabdus parva]